MSTVLLFSKINTFHETSVLNACFSFRYIHGFTQNAFSRTKRDFSQYLFDEGIFFLFALIFCLRELPLFLVANHIEMTCQTKGRNATVINSAFAVQNWS